MTDDELLAVYRDGRFRDLIDALRGVAAAAWAEGTNRQWAYGPHSIPNEYVPNPYAALSPEGTA